MWTDDAACLGMDIEKFYNTHPEMAIGTCARCRIRERCLEFALQAEDGLGPTRRFGVFGGTTGPERARISGYKRKRLKASG